MRPLFILCASFFISAVSQAFQHGPPFGIGQPPGGPPNSMVPTQLPCPWLLMPAGPTFAQRASMPSDSYLGSASATAPDGRIYAAGGDWPAPLEFNCIGLVLYAWRVAPTGTWGGMWRHGNVVSYDPLADEWREEPTMNAGRAGHSLITGVDGKLYAIGGDVGGTIESYVIAAQAWSYVGALPSSPASAWVGPYNFAATTDRDGNIFVLGGDDNAEAFGGTNTVSKAVHRWTWDPVSRQYTTWTQFPSMTLPREGHKALTALDGRLYVFCEDGQIETMDPSAAVPQWTVLSTGSGVQGIGFGAVASPRDFFFVAGGRFPYLSGSAALSPGGYAVRSQSPGASIWDWMDPLTSEPYLKIRGLKSYLSLATAEGQLFALGGAQRDNPCSTVDDWSTAVWRWRNDVSSYGTFAVKLSPALTSLWRFDESPGALFAFDAVTGDTAPYLGNGTGPGRVTVGSAPGAVKFTGGAAFTGINILSSTTHCNLGAGSATIEGWIRAPQMPGVQTIIDKRSGLESTPRGYTLFLATNNKLGFQIANGTTYLNYISPVSFESDVWTHFAVVLDRPATGLQSVTLYVNGVQVRHDSGTLAGDMTNSALCYIGCHSYSGTVFNGMLDELSYYNRPLNWLEVRSVFVAGQAGKR